MVQGISEEDMIRRGMQQYDIAAYSILYPQENLILDRVRFINQTQFPIGVATIHNRIDGVKRSVIISAAREDDDFRQYRLNAIGLKNLYIRPVRPNQVDNPMVFFKEIADRIQREVPIDRERALDFASQLFHVGIVENG